MEVFPFFNERRQQDGKDISEAKREVSALRGNKIGLNGPKL